MQYIYDMVLKRGVPGKSDVVGFYDEDREKVIEMMKKYDKKHGFSIDTPEGTFTIENIVLRKRTPTGEVISETSFCKIFDVYMNRIDGGGDDIHERESVRSSEGSP